MCIMLPLFITTDWGLAECGGDGGALGGGARIELGGALVAAVEQRGRVVLLTIERGD